MRKHFLLLVVTFFCVASAAEARVPGLMNGGEDYLSTSLQYQVTSGNFDRVNSNDRNDTNVHQRLQLIRLDLTPFEQIQLYGTAGNARTTVADTDTDHGTVLGGGVQVLVSRSNDLRLELIGSYLQHEAVALGETGEEVEVKQDWQGGIQLSRTVKPSRRYSGTLDYDAYLSILYSGRTVEISGTGTPRELEMANAGGVSATAGLNFHYSENIDLEFEGEFGAMTSGSARLIFSF